MLPARPVYPLHRPSITLSLSWIIYASYSIYEKPLSVFQLSLKNQVALLPFFMSMVTSFKKLVYFQYRGLMGGICRFDDGRLCQISCLLRPGEMKVDSLSDWLLLYVVCIWVLSPGNVLSTEDWPGNDHHHMPTEIQDAQIRCEIMIIRSINMMTNFSCSTGRSVCHLSSK